MTMSERHPASPKRVEELGETIPEVSREIKSGKALLRVVAYPWGVEMDVCEPQEGGWP